MAIAPGVHINQIDKFDSPLLVYKTDLIPDTIYITESFEKLNDIRWLKRGEGSKSNTLYVEDVFSYNDADGKEALCIINDQCVFHITKSKSSKPETLLDVVKKRGSFWCPSKSSEELLRILVVASGGDANQVMFDKDKANAYAIVHFEPLHNARSSSDIIDVIDYSTALDIHKLKLFIPYALLENIDMSLYYNNLLNKKFATKTLLVFKKVIWMYKDNSIPHECLNEIFHRIAQVDDTSYFSMHIKVCQTTLEYLQKASKYTTIRQSLPILEQFEPAANPIVLEPQSNLVGFYEARKKLLTVSGDSLEGIPYDVIKQIVLKKQVRSEENGIYIVKGMTSTYTVLQKIRSNPTEKKVDVEYHCVGDSTIKNKGFCDSIFDESEQLKKNRTVWDKPCVENTECPFYQANKLYKNYRGGCNDGYCEMPIGVTRIGFTKFEGKPMCHDCSVLNPKCCDNQANANYAFELDEVFRKEYVEIPK